MAFVNHHANVGRGRYRIAVKVPSALVSSLPIGSEVEVNDESVSEAVNNAIN